MIQEEYKTDRDSLEELYEIKDRIAAEFKNFDEFFDWLLVEQEKFKREGTLNFVQGVAYA